jgi:hypothetical protein
MSQLPEKWYCEMNKWDLERATCDGAEESDSEDEGRSRVRTQIVFNKGPSALSYRRIIFGTDGRIRPIYNEKNRNGYGVFSHCDTHKHNAGDHDDEYVEPLRKLSYWHSSAYFDANAVARKAESEAAAAAVAVPTAASAAGGADATTTTNGEATIVPGNNGGDCNSVPSTAAPAIPPTPRDTRQEVEKQRLKDLADRPEPPFLARVSACSIDPAQFQGNLFDLAYASSQPIRALLPLNKKISKYPQVLSSITAFRRESIECDIVKKCLLAKPPGVNVTFSELAKSVVSTRFSSVEVEAVRIAMTMQVMRDAIRRLEMIGEVMVCLNGVGEMCVRPLGILEPLKEYRVADGLPLKMRKFFGRQHHMDTAEA